MQEKQETFPTFGNLPQNIWNASLSYIMNAKNIGNMEIHKIARTTNLEI